jgi:hypothetical protein
VALATAPDGQLAALLSCFSATWDGPALLVRRGDGVWGTLQPVRVPSWYGADGALVVLGDGPEARAGPAGRTVYLISRRLADPGPARVIRVPVPAAGLPADSRFQHTQARGFTRPGPDGTPQPGVIFTWTAPESGRAYALTSLDGGASWRPAETVVALGGPRRVPFASPAYDPAADRLLVLWTCCDDALFETRPSSHYASWSAPGSGVWHTASASAPVPLALGSRAASSSAVGQAQGGRTAWLAWVEAQRQLEVRSFDLSQVLPAEALPTPSPTVPPQPEGATP